MYDFFVGATIGSWCGTIFMSAIGFPNVWPSVVFAAFCTLMMIITYFLEGDK